MKVPFNKPFIVGKELYNIAQAVIESHLSGDGQFTGHVQPDGKILPAQPRARTTLDDLADAVDQADSTPWDPDETR